MTVSNESFRTIQSSDGVQLVFAFDFQIQGVDVTDWAPQIEVKENLTVTVKTYVISSVTPAGGTITFTIAPVSGTLAIIRTKQNAQGASYPVTEPFPSKSVELSLDDLTLQVQDIKALSEQGIRQNSGELALDMVLPDVNARANNILAFDSSGNVAVRNAITTIVVDDVVTFESVTSMKSAAVALNVQVRTVSFTAGWEIAGIDPSGGETYNVVTLAQYQAITGDSVVDEVENFELANGNIALLDTTIIYEIMPWEVGVVDTSSSWLNGNRYGCKGDNGITDNAPFLTNLFLSAGNNQTLIDLNTGPNQRSGTKVEFEPGAYYTSALTSIPSRTRIDGNNSAFYTDPGVTIFNIYGFETVLSQMRFYLGATALNYTQGNVDTSVSQIHDCYFEGQTDVSIKSIGTQSTHLKLTDNKFIATARIIETDCDETSITGGWVSAKTTGISYYKTTGHLYIHDVLLVPSGITDATTTHWVQLGAPGNLVGNLSMRQVRFGGESGMGYVKSYARANSTGSEIKRTINVQNCELWGSGGFDLEEIPNSFVLKNNHIAVSTNVSINTVNANPIVATAQFDGFQIEEDRIVWDAATNAYMYGEPTNQGQGKNQIATNASFSGFALASDLAGGTVTSTPDVFPENSIRQVTTGVKTSEPQLFVSFAMAATGLTGIHTLQIYVKSDVGLSIQLTSGITSRRFPIEGNDTPQLIRLVGLLTSGGDNIIIAAFDMPDNATLTIGHPIVLKGNIKADILLQVPSSTTSTVQLINGKYYTSAIPVDGFWNSGITLYDLSPAVDQIGWVCTVSGAPGTWVAF